MTTEGSPLFSLPIKSVLMVTHNIEEAVLMCDRILIFSSNPGRVIGEISVSLPQQRAAARTRRSGDWSTTPTRA